jgi:DNA-binding NtrC family response regulator
MISFGENPYRKYASNSISNAPAKQVPLPPLRQRKSDIPELVQYFVERKSAELKLPSIPKVAPNGLEALADYDWHGNAREPANIVERALILNPHGPISFENLGSSPPQSKVIQPQSESTILKLDEMIAKHIKRALDTTNGRIHGKGGAAELLGINASTLRSRMKKLEIR